jgi:hypothetical protein
LFFFFFRSRKPICPRLPKVASASVWESKSPFAFEKQKRKKQNFEIQLFCSFLKTFSPSKNEIEQP